MAALDCQILLLGIAICILHLSVVRCQLCGSDFTLHESTGTCMKLVLTKEAYINAKWYCEQNIYWGNLRKTGHLVYIFDEDTDNFVKGLLDKHEVDSALIGLHDRGINGNYTWGDINTIPATYIRWSTTPHIADGRKNAVIITKNGWEEYDGYSSAYFVCQVNLDFPTPRIVCPVAEERHDSPAISCTVDTPHMVTITSVSFQNIFGDVASCGAYYCWPNQNYKDIIDIRKSQDTSSASWTLTIKNVPRSAETNWTCSVKFNNIRLPVISKPCRLTVYTKPENIQCTHTIVESKVTATCVTTKVYPPAVCTWDVSRLVLGVTSQVTVFNTTYHDSPDYIRNSVGYYETTCTAAFSVRTTGIYTVTVSMVPNLPGFGGLHNPPATTQHFTVSAVPPTEAPVLYGVGQTPLPPELKVTENQTVIIICRVLGGDPPVYRTTISCGNMAQSYQAEGSSATMNVRVSRDLHGQTCTCSALHAVQYTHTSKVKILVYFPTTVTSFRITDTSGGTEIDRGEDIILKCSANGNPQPEVTVYRLNGLNVLNADSRVGDPGFTDVTVSKRNVTCSDMGMYGCFAKNTVNYDAYNDRKVAQLNVNCQAEFCNGVSIQNVAATVNQNIIFKICVRAYPGPTSFTLYRGEYRTGQKLNATKFQAQFSFTSQEDGLGEITIMLSPFTQTDIGDYELYSEYRNNGVRRLYSYLKLHLSAQGPPSCPTNFTIERTGPDSVTLSWEPGFNGGLNQTFTVVRVDLSAETSSSSVGRMELGTVEEDRNVYDATGLSERTMYTFGIEVSNEKGYENCSHLLVNVTTSASSAAVAGADVATKVAPVIVVVILAVLVVAVVLVVRRRRGYVYKKPVHAADNVRAGAGGTSILASSQHNGDENVYANNSASTSIIAANKQETPGKQTTEEADLSSTYEEVNKTNKKKALKLTEKPPRKKKVKQEQESVYSLFTRNIKKKGEQKSNNEQIYNELAGVYSNVSKFAVAQTSGAADQDNIYVNASSSGKKENTPNKNKNNARTVNEDGLIYVSVEINKKTTNPEIMTEKKKTEGKMAAKKSERQEEAVEYTALDFSSPAKHQ